MRTRASWVVMTVLAFVVVLYAVALLVVPAARAPFLRDRVARVPLAVYAHLSASAIALAFGPFQLNAKMRVRRLGLHRWMGRVYLLCVLVGGTSGFAVAMASMGGTIAHAGFALLAVAWMATAVMAYRRIRAGDSADHRRWMIRNYSLTFAAVTLRIYLPAAVAFGIPFDEAYPAIAWLCWVPNLVVSEWWFVRRRIARAELTAAV